MALIGGGAFFLFRRQRAKKPAPPPKGSELDGSASGNPYLVNQTRMWSAPQEKYAHEVAVRAPSEYPMQELSAHSRPVEMDGSGMGSPKLPYSFA